MSQDVDTLRAAFAARSQPESALASCPEPERVYDAALGRLPLTERLEVVDHVAGCAHCANAWRLAREMQPGAESRRRLGAPLAAAAVLVVAVGVVQLLPPPEPVYRDAGGETPLSLVTEPSLPRSAFVLRWSPPPSGATSTLRVLRNDLEPLLSISGLPGSSYRVPPDALEDVPSGAQLLWQVEVRLPGNRRVTSETFVVTLR
jgi:hypothetical protein